jgi:hypothetical protein
MISYAKYILNGNRVLSALHAKLAVAAYMALCQHILLSCSVSLCIAYPFTSSCIP